MSTISYKASTLVVYHGNCLDRLACEHPGIPHRRMVKVLQKQIADQQLLENSNKEELVSFSHPKEGFTSFKIRVDGVNIINVDVHTIYE